VACVPEDIVHADITSGRLQRILADWCPPFPGYHLYYPSRRQPSPAFSPLLKALQENGQEGGWRCEGRAYRFDRKKRMA